MPRPKKYTDMFLASEVAKALGVTATTLRAWEKCNKIPPATRDPRNGYRTWSVQDMTQMKRTIKGGA